MGYCPVGIRKNIETSDEEAHGCPISFIDLHGDCRRCGVGHNDADGFRRTISVCHNGWTVCGRCLYNVGGCPDIVREDDFELGLCVARTGSRYERCSLTIQDIQKTRHGCRNCLEETSYLGTMRSIVCPSNWAVCRHCFPQECKAYMKREPENPHAVIGKVSWV